MSIFTRLTNRLFGPEIERRAALAAARAIDSSYDRPYSTRFNERDRLPANRDEVLMDALNAWRDNALARRIVELTTQYVVGGGINIECQHNPTHEFLQKWWRNPQNNMSLRTYEMCDELSRSGELFVILSTDAAGMTYIRCIPAMDVIEIEAAPNDIEQERVIYERPNFALGETSTPGPNGPRGRAWTVYDPNNDEPDENGLWPVRIIHFPVNRPVGAQFGESDLAAVTRWLVRYSAMVEDRIRLNRFRQAFYFIVKSKFGSPEEKKRRQEQLNANPPAHGSILVTDDSEAWGVLHPQLDSFEAGEDILAVKKIIAAGTGTPLHFMAEPESATRTTAEAAGGPTYRRYEQRQRYFLWMIETLADIAVERRSRVDHRVSRRIPILCKGSDISGRDNAALASAANFIQNAGIILRERNWIDDAELLRLFYRFAGESVDVEAMLIRGKAAGPCPLPPMNPIKNSTTSSGGDRMGAVNLPKLADLVDKETGEPKGV